MVLQKVYAHTYSSVAVHANWAYFLFVAPTDYVTQTGSLTISGARATECVSIPILADGIDEPDMECFAASISSTSPGLLLNPSVATICINEG